MRLGDILVKRGAISRERLEALAHRATTRIGEYLVAHTDIGARAMAMALAEHHQLAYVEFTQTPPDRRLFQSHRVEDYLAHRYLPFTHRGHTLTIATTHPSDVLAARVRAETGLEVEQVVTSTRDWMRYLTEAGALRITRRAQSNAHHKRNRMTAHRVMEAHQARGLLALLVLAVIAFVTAPHSSWYALLVGCNFFYLTTLAFKLQLYSEGIYALKQHTKLRKQLAADIAAMNDGELPSYSVLIPMYHEPQPVIARLLNHLLALDYPREKLDILFIIEADDVATLEAIHAVKPPEMVRIVRVPPSKPRTKPKACNVALHYATGELLVIYDAEDAPEPLQLKKAVAQFRRAPEAVACLQAPLNYYNRSENLLTQLFAIEYSSLFRLQLPAMERLGMPIPLGGTSNHIKREALDAAGGWDAFNVTEDADLGMRLAFQKRTTQMLPSLTLEECPITLGAWMKQRTRWIKGYIQTWLVYMRNPDSLRETLGRKAYYGFQFFVGAPALTFLLAPVFWVVFLVSLLGILPIALSPYMLSLCLISLVGGIVSHWMFARRVLKIEGWKRMRRAMLIYPFYWLLHSVACARALWQLATAPHYWEKTRHGVSKKMGVGV